MTYCLNYSIEKYLKFLDSIIAECNSVYCLTSSSNAMTRRAKSTYFSERNALSRLAALHTIAEFHSSIYDKLWQTRLHKQLKYGLLVESYLLPRGGVDTRFPTDGRLIPAYAKAALAQLRTLAACVNAVIEAQDKIATS